jgi:uncharacterized protein (DUF433 family)
MQQASKSNLFTTHQTRRFSKIPTMNYRNHITIEANKRGGKPCVRGLRITVYEVLEYLASEMTEAEIQGRFSRSDARRFKSLHCLCC